MIEILTVDSTVIWSMCTVAIIVRFFVECNYQVAMVTLITNECNKQVALRTLKNKVYRGAIAFAASLPTIAAASFVYLFGMHNLFIYAWTIMSITRSLKLWLECSDSNEHYRYPQDSTYFIRTRMCLLILGLLVNLV